MTNRPLNIVLRKIRAFLTGRDSGAALVEFAVLGSLLLGLALYAMDFGLFAFNKMEVQNAAQAGAQYAIANATYSSSSMSSAMASATRFTAITPSSTQFCGCPATSGVTFCAASCDLCNTGTCATTVQGHYVTATATANYTPLVKFGQLSASSYNITAQSTVRIR